MAQQRLKTQDFRDNKANLKGHGATNNGPAGSGTSQATTNAQSREPLAKFIERGEF